jgi:ABC-type sugar transport system substrate-binding protein
LKITTTLVTAATLCLAVLASPLAAQDATPGAGFYNALKGKKIGFVPIAMGFNETQAWRTAMERQAAALGYEIIVRDPNWSIEAGIQAINSLIDEKPDILIIENIDNRSYNRMVQKSIAAGILTIQTQQRSEIASDAYMGPDWNEMGRNAVDGMVQLCGTDSGKNGKIAIIQGALTAPASLLQQAGIDEALKAHPEITVVSNQAADWDATKAYQIATTVLQQEPDLCGIVGFWDVADAGIASAVKEANLQGKVAVITSGSGARDSACDKIASGDFTFYTSYNTAGQGRDLNAIIRTLLQTMPAPGSKPFDLLSPLIRITKDTMTPSSCWTLDELAHIGG